MTFPTAQPMVPAARMTGVVKEVHADYLIVEIQLEVPTSRAWLPDGTQAPRKYLQAHAEIDRYYAKNWMSGIKQGSLVNEFANFFDTHVGMTLDVDADYQVGDHVMVKGQHALNEKTFVHTFNPWGPAPRMDYVYKYWAIGRIQPPPPAP